jgi:hypothetical protein
LFDIIVAIKNMAAELEKLARELAAKGYVDAALHFQKEAVEFRQKGLIPAALSVQERAEITPQELATQAYAFASFLSDYPDDPEAFTYFDVPNGKFMLMRYGGTNPKTVLHSANELIPTETHTAGLTFEANIEPLRREEIKQLGVDAAHVIATGAHLEASSMDRARALLAADSSNWGRFETDYYIGENGAIAKLSLVPITFDTRPDTFNKPLSSLGMKRLRTDVTAEDLQYLDKSLSILESATPRTVK